MLRRMAVEELKGITTQYEVEVLKKHLDGRFAISRGEAEVLRDIYAKLPEQYRASGVIYRGMMIKDIEGVESFVKNRVFTGEDRESKYVESWSTIDDSAISFSQFNPKASKLGVVVQSTVEEQDVIMEWGAMASSYFVSKGDQFVENEEEKWWVVDLLNQLINEYAIEGEVVVAPKKNQSYRLCVDVKFVTLSLESAADQKVMDMLLPLIISGDREKVYQWGEDQEWVGRQKMVFDCFDGELAIRRDG